MNKMPLVLLSAFLLAVAGAWYLARTSAPVQDVASEPLSQNLQESINNVRKLTIRGNGNDVILAGYGSDWTVANRGDYPALFGNVRNLLISLAEARIIEYKTNNPELYDRLGLQDLDEEGSGASQVVVEDGTGKIMLDVIIGDQSTGAISGSYARLGDDPRSFLLDRELSVDARIKSWLDAELTDIDADRIKEIMIRIGGEQPLKIYREDREQQDFAIADIPAGQEVGSQTTLNRMGTILAVLSASDVVAKESFSFSEAAIKTRVITFDGLVVDVTAEYSDGVAYATMDFAADEEAIKAMVLADGEDEGSTEIDVMLDKIRDEAAALGAKFDNWIYEIPYFKYDMFDRKSGGLLDEKAEQEPLEASE